MKYTIKVHDVGFSTDDRSPLPEALCCTINHCLLPVDVVLGSVGMYSYPILLILILLRSREQ